MQIFCNSSESIIRSKKSSNIFSSIVKTLFLDDYLDLLKIFNKVKSCSQISIDEENMLIDCIISDRFREEYEKFSKTFI
jgi:hypothetical protein